MLKEGNELILGNTLNWNGNPEKFKIQLVTDKAIKIDGVWIPKSKIIGVTKLGITIQQNFDEYLCKFSKKSSSYRYVN